MTLSWLVSVPTLFDTWKGVKRPFKSQKIADLQVTTFFSVGTLRLSLPPLNQVRWVRICSFCFDPTTGSASNSHFRSLPGLFLGVKRVEIPCNIFFSKELVNWSIFGKYWSQIPYSDFLNIPRLLTLITWSRNVVEKWYTPLRARLDELNTGI